jgi:hypothetical protein
LGGIDRICGKRLRPLLPILVEAMERHGHIQLAPEVRTRLLAMSAATIDRALRDIRRQAGTTARRRSAPSAAIRRSVPVRTFDDWDDPPPGFVEADLVAHSGPVARGSFVQTLVLTDIATGWTECAQLLVREQRLLTEVLGELRKLLPFPLLGLDTDNDSVFMNETVRDYCEQVAIAFTRCRPYRENDQAWVEQKNGAVVRRMIGYRRFEGLEAAAALARLYAAVRLFVNFFQPSFKLAPKARDGAVVRKRYHYPATPCQRLMADPRTSEEVRRRVNELHATLDPVRLPQQIRAAQQQLVDIADRPALGETAKPTSATLEEFLSGLRTVWREGEVRPTSIVKPKPKRSRRRPDPFAAVTVERRGWFEAEPWHTSRELLERLQAECPGVYPDGRLRTLRRRLKEWRREAAHQMVFGTMIADPAFAPSDGEQTFGQQCCKLVLRRSRRWRQELCGFAAALGRRCRVAHNSTGPTSVSIDLDLRRGPWLERKISEATGTRAVRQHLCFREHPPVKQYDPHPDCRCCPYLDRRAVGGPRRSRN